MYFSSFWPHISVVGHPRLRDAYPGKGKPVVRRGRKATGLPWRGDGRTAERRGIRADHFLISNAGRCELRWAHEKAPLNVETNQVTKIRDPDLTRLRDLPRAEAMRIAMIKHGWDAETAGRKVDIEQGRYADEVAVRENQGGG